uniref:Uncharacterized protein n=1 Tax=Heterorhabditis bacteriophora TaxID=37862 RepID=A0A1I7XNN9_HETBA
MTPFGYKDLQSKRRQSYRRTLHKMHGCPFVKTEPYAYHHLLLRTINLLASMSFLRPSPKTTLFLRL